MSALCQSPTHSTLPAILTLRNHWKSIYLASQRREQTMRADVSLAIKVWVGIAAFLSSLAIMYWMDWYPPSGFWRGFWMVLFEVLGHIK
jgi:hypothetical protein